MAEIIDLRKGAKKPASASKPLPFGAPRRGKGSNLRSRRRKIRLLTLIALVLLLCLGAYGIHALSYMRDFNVQKITVTGAESIDTSGIESYVREQLGQDGFHYLSLSNIFIYPKDELERGIINSFPHVKTVFISRSAPLSTTVEVAISERQPYARWCTDVCYPMDDEGIVYGESSEVASTTFETPYQFSGGIEGDPAGKTYLPGRFASVLALLRIIQQQSHLTPLGIEAQEVGDFTVQFTEGFTLKATFGLDAATLARNLDLVLSSEALHDRKADIEYVDLRFGNRVYYKLKGEEQSNI